MPPRRQPRTDEAEAWYSSVYMTVQLIPSGHVTTYGHIAFLIGRPECPRQVGIALKNLPLPTEDTTFNSDTVPWQRVISASGKISDRGDGGAGKLRQVEALRGEGVTVVDDKVDFAECGWFPRELPDEDAVEES